MTEQPPTPPSRRRFLAAIGIFAGSATLLLTTLGEAGAEPVAGASQQAAEAPAPQRQEPKAVKRVKRVMPQKHMGGY